MYDSYMWLITMKNYRRTKMRLSSTLTRQHPGLMYCDRVTSVSRYILFWIKKLKALNKLEINRKSSKCFSLHLQIFSHCTFSPSNITTAKVVAMCAHHHGFNLLMPFCFSHRRFPALSEGWWHLSMEFCVIGYFEMVHNLY